MLATNKSTELICNEDIHLRLIVVTWKVIVDVKVSSVWQISAAAVFVRNH